MNLEELKESLDAEAPPARLPDAVKALWYARKGDWRKAHEIAQGVASADGSWVHAHLHREEGDLGNARYWYGRADRVESKASLEEEWEEIARELLREETQGN